MQNKNSSFEKVVTFKDILLSVNWHFENFEVCRYICMKQIIKTSAGASCAERPQQDISCLLYLLLLTVW